MNLAAWCARSPWAALLLAAALWFGMLAVILWVDREPASERVVISCPVGTVQIAKIDGVWSCIQEGEAG